MPSRRNASSQGYGTIEDALPQRQEDGPADDTEHRNASQQPTGEAQTAVKNSDSPSFPRHVQRHMVVEIDTRWADLVLILCFFVSGLIDSITYNTYSCFASMQTGMLILHMPSVLIVLVSFVMQALMSFPSIVTLSFRA